MRFIVSSFPGREHWRADIEADLDGYDYTVVDGWELDAIYYGAATMSEPFIHLQDSWRVLDVPALLAKAEMVQGSASISDCPWHFGCYAGVYEPNVLERIVFPEVRDKEHAIHLERYWHEDYVKALGYHPACLYPGLFHDSRGTVVEHHGRSNLLLGNDELRKYKGTWR